MEFWNGSIDAGMRRRSDGGEAGVMAGIEMSFQWKPYLAMQDLNNVHLRPPLNRPLVRLKGG